MNQIKYAFIMMCLILSYGFCAFAEDGKLEVKYTDIESSIDLSTVSDLMPDQDDDSAYKDFEPDYVFTESDEAQLERDIGNY